MSLYKYITNLPFCQRRRLIVRLIEDAIAFLALCIGTAAACVLLSAALKWLGVG